jgi:phospholipase C
MLVVPAVLAVLGVGCSNGSSGDAPGGDASDAGVDTAVEDTAEQEDAGPIAPPDWDRAVTPPADDEAQKQRAACGYKAGALAGETQGASHPTGKNIPIDHVIVILQENRSFDHYFGRLRAAGHPDAEVPPDGWSNPGVDGKPVLPYRDQQLCLVDLSHGWNGAHREWNDGKMDGFVIANDHQDDVPPGGTDDMVKGDRAMSYYEPEDLPFMYWAADQFAIADHYHCSVLTSTWSNRMYMYAASSFGRISNKSPDTGSALILFDELQMRRVTWKVYYTGSPISAMFVGQFLRYKDFHFVPIEQYYDDVKNGTLPQVAFLDSAYGSGAFDEKEDDEHPNGVMQVGQAFLARATKALMQSPLWPSSAIFITYDEHGGFADHVPPPAACPPDSRPPQLGTGDVPGGYDRLGMRVPMVMISPWAKKGAIAHHVMDHTSIVRFIEARFDLPAMSARDANAEAPWEMFDFAKVRADLPAVPDVPIDTAKLAACKKIFGVP